MKTKFGRERVEGGCRKDNIHVLLQSSGEYPCTFCRTRVGSKSTGIWNFSVRNHINIMACPIAVK